MTASISPFTGRDVRQGIEGHACLPVVILGLVPRIYDGPIESASCPVVGAVDPRDKPEDDD